MDNHSSETISERDTRKPRNVWIRTQLYYANTVVSGMWNANMYNSLSWVFPYPCLVFWDYWALNNITWSEEFLEVSLQKNWRKLQMWVLCTSISRNNCAWQLQNYGPFITLRLNILDTVHHILVKWNSLWIPPSS